MISEKMEAELNEQVNKEFYSAYLYLAMAAYCTSIGLPGFSHWMRLHELGFTLDAEASWGY
ncbi:MAG: ferritin-like domain-containing protein [bacterium]